jgi:hypothetical protein
MPMATISWPADACHRREDDAMPPPDPAEGVDSRPPGHLVTPPHAPDRNLALDLVRVTEAAAMAAGRWVGRGDKNAPTASPSTPCGS